MKIVIASDSFKGSLSSKRIGEIFATTAKEVSEEIEIIPIEIADGGEGTLDAVVDSGKFSYAYADSCNPLFEKITVSYGVCGKTAFVEMAKSSGLTLIPYKEGNALKTTTYGTGQTIAEAVRKGAEEVIVSVGGSATNDGGIGALSALGCKFFDCDGKEILPVGENLIKIKSVDTKNISKFGNIKFKVLTDVDNPLLGEFGATKFYGKQKGASGKNAEILEEGMINFAMVTEKATGVILDDMKGAGAAGGLAGGLVAYLGAEIKSGIETVLDVIGFEEKLNGATAVITGEGRIDDQSTHGKAISGVCGRAKKYGLPVYATVGCSRISKINADALGLREIYELSELAVDLEDSIRNAEKYVKIVAKNMLTKIYKGEK